MWDHLEKKLSFFGLVVTTDATSMKPDLFEFFGFISCQLSAGKRQLIYSLLTIRWPLGLDFAFISR